MAERVALVTGGSSGIGERTAIRLQQAGFTTYAVARRVDRMEGLEQAGITTFAMDVTDDASMTSGIERISGEHGPLDVLVNNAGVGMSARFADMAVDDWRWIRGVNLDGVVNGCAAFTPAMVAAGRGHVVNVSSGLGYTPTATEPAYVTTKAAVLALSQCLRADFAKDGIGVTAICPGVINTPIIDSTRFLGEAADPKRRARTVNVFRRGHKPEQVAAAIVDAVARNRAVVPVGFEAKAGWWLHKFAPIAAQQFVARRGLK